MRLRSNAADEEKTKNKARICNVNTVGCWKLERAGFGFMCGNAQKSVFSARTVGKE